MIALSSIVMDSNNLYSSIAKVYNSLLRLTDYMLAITYFIKRIPLATDSPILVLDVGCGTGFYSFAVLQRFPHATIIAFDINREMLNEFRARLAKHQELFNRVRIFTADLTGPLPVMNQSVDLLIAGGVLEYVDITKAAQSLSQYLMPGGYFLNVSVANNLIGRIIGRLYRFRPYSQQQKIVPFIDNGLTLVRIMKYPFAREAYLFKKPAP